jgi:hypothetical protein
MIGVVFMVMLMQIVMVRMGVVFVMRVVTE